MMWLNVKMLPSYLARLSVQLLDGKKMGDFLTDWLQTSELGKARRGKGSCSENSLVLACLQ